MSRVIFSSAQREAMDEELIECAGCGYKSSEDRDFAKFDGELYCQECQSEFEDSERQEWDP